MNDQPNLGLATTGQLLDELDARNEGGQRPHFQKNREQASYHIGKLRVAFAIRDGGLGYRTVDK